MVLVEVVSHSLIEITFACSISARSEFGMLRMACRASFGVDRSTPLMHSAAARWVFSAFKDVLLFEGWPLYQHPMLKYGSDYGGADPSYKRATARFFDLSAILEF